MKAAAGFLGALVGLLIVCGLGYLLLRKPAAGTASAGTATSAGAPPLAPGGSPHPAQPIAPPVSREEQLRQDLERKRIPYFHFLVTNFGSVIVRPAVLEDYDTLDLIVNRSDDATVSMLVTQAVAPSAKDYGFSRVRFYTPNPPGSVQPYTVFAEATDDGTGHWTVFKK